jgi:hypothetical protein
MGVPPDGGPGRTAASSAVRRRCRLRRRSLVANHAKRAGESPHRSRTRSGERPGVHRWVYAVTTGSRRGNGDGWSLAEAAA